MHIIINLKLNVGFPECSYVVVFRHSEENTEDVKFSTFKGPLLHNFYEIQK